MFGFNKLLCMNTIQSSTLSIDPERLTQNDSLTPSVGSALVSEFKTCPQCSAEINPDPRDGKFIDRDIVWDSDISNSEYHTCDSCGSDLKILVEEKANPTLYPSISDERWAENVTWIETENNFVALTLGSIYITSV